MKKAVITILGLIGHEDKVPINIIDEKISYKFKPRTDKNKASYRIDTNLDLDFKIEENEKHINMFTLLTKKYKDIPVIAIGTKKAIKIQKATADYENIKHNNIKYILIDEKLYDDTLTIINEEIDNYETIIFDVSHGFRHLPILAIISLIVQNIKDIDKVENILFAKEIKPQKEYNIIDLKSYLDIANFSYILSNFQKNYTLGNTLSFHNEKYQELVENLQILSTHILSNSLQQLFNKEKNTLDETIQNLKELSKDKNIKTFEKFINEISDHLYKIKGIVKLSKYKQLLKMSKMMKERDYLLNAVTLLNESIGFYCVEVLSSLDSKIKNHIDCYNQIANSNDYELAHQSKNIIKNNENFNGAYLYTPDKQKLTSGQKTSLQKKKKNLKNKIPADILSYIEKEGFEVSLSKKVIKENFSIKDIIIDKIQDNNFDELKELIIVVEKLRNNLAHGNSSDKLDNIKLSITKYIRNFEKIIEIK